MTTTDSPAAKPRFEPPPTPATTPRRVLSDFGLLYAVNGLVGVIFAATGPVAVILAVGVEGGLDQRQIASWVFGVFFLNGVLTVLACWIYRQPLAFMWTIPGTVLIGPALGHLSLGAVVGAYVVTGALILTLGLTGLIRTATAAIPLPIVMGMVAGVFLGFGTGLVRAVTDDVVIAAPMVLAFLVLTAWPAAARKMPPIVGALLAGVAAVAFTGALRIAPGAAGVLAVPVFTAPAWSWQAMLELVVPLAITVIVVQNGQGIAVLRTAGHDAPVNVATALCGVWSVLAAGVGAVSTCLTGPTNALLTASGERSRQYTAGIACGLFAVAFGAFAPLFTQLMLATPPAFVATLGGLAMLKVLQVAFSAAFGGRFTLSALVTFVVAASGITVLSIGGPFWGLVAGLGVAWSVERGDFASDREPRV